MSNNQKKPSAYKIMFDIVNSLKYYKTQQKGLLVEVDINGRTDIVDVRDTDFKYWCINEMNKQGKAIDKLPNIISRLSAKIWASTDEIEVHTRIAGNNNEILYDLADEKGRIIKVTANKCKIIYSENCSQKFVRSTIMMKQVAPQLDAKLGIKDLKKYLNISSDESFNLLLVYIISCLVPNIPHPIAIFTGSQGAAKTTASKLIKRIVDPALIDTVSLPKDKKDLVVQLNRGHMIFFDNISRINDDFNDVFCQTATGGYQIARKLFTDNEIVAYKLQKCLILNGIANLSEKADLLDRAISIRFERIADTSRLSENEIFSKFEKDLPYFVGSALQVLSKAMSIYPDVKLQKLPRMADFAQWGYAIAEALGIGGDNFIKIYEKNRKEIGFDLIQENATSKGILDFMAQPKLKGYWKGSVKDFWVQLDRFALRTGINREDKSWAATENVLGKWLEEAKVSLEGQGLTFDKKNVGTHKQLTIRYTKKAL